VGRPIKRQDFLAKSAQASAEPGLIEQMMVSPMMNPGADARIVVLHGDVNEHSISAVIAQLLYLANQSNKPIYFVLSTYGGSIDEAAGAYDVMKFLKAPVYTIGIGKIMSAGILLLAAGAKGHRVVGPTSRLMLHPISGGVSGTVFDVLNETEEMTRLQDNFEKTLSKETKMSKKDIHEIMKKGHDYYIDAEKAIELGIIDKVIGG